MKLTITLTLFIAAVVAACAFIQHRNRAASAEKAAALAQQSEQIANLQSEQQRLSSLAAQATNDTAPVPDRQAELDQLRAQATSLRQQTNRLAKEAKTALSASSRPSSAPEPHPPEYWEQLHKAVGTKAVDARDVAAAAYTYAMDHGNLAPTNMIQIAKYLSQFGRGKAPPTNRFEFVFAGSLDQLKGIPNTSIAIVRDTQTWTTPDGKQARVYGMMGGVGQIVTSDDNFQSWEAEHVISAPSK
jgi:hypothetical protein